MTDLLIRDARPGDLAAVRDLTLAAYQEYEAQIPAHWDAYRENILGALADVAPAAHIVAERAGTLLGSVLLYPAGSAVAIPRAAPVPRRWPEVRLLAVAPAARGLGVGAALMAECVRRARAAGESALSLHTTPMMRAARRIYERMGFVRAPELDFRLAPDLAIDGYRLDLERPAP